MIAVTCVQLQNDCLQCHKKANHNPKPFDLVLAQLRGFKRKTAGKKRTLNPSFQLNLGMI